MTTKNRLPEDIENQLNTALGNNELDKALLVLHNYINLITYKKNSWDSPQYQANRDVQEKIVLDYSRDNLLTYMGLETLRDRYFLRTSEGEICEDVQKFFSRVATGIAGEDLVLAQEIYECISTLKFMPATPILSNIGTTRGLPISCFLNTVGDSISGIMRTLTENAHLSKSGGGIGTDWSELRGKGAIIESINGKSSGIVPFIKTQESLSLAVHQGGLRRGSSSAYLRVDHPDIEEFISLRKPNGDVNRKTLELHNAVIVTDLFMRAVQEDKDFALIDPTSNKEVKVVKAKELWKKILKCRVETGEPYIMFYDTVQEGRADCHKELGLEIRQSNLCSEILEPTSSERTAVCCLGSINLEAIDSLNLKQDLREVSRLATKILNKVLDIFIQTDKEGFERAIYSASQERSIGIGVMGFHGFLMKEKAEVGSVLSKTFNKIIFSTIKESALEISKELLEQGVHNSQDNKGYANTYLMAIAPTANISIIAGGATPCIEPIAGNAYTHKTLSGTFLVKNKYLEEVLESLDKNDDETWESIIVNSGSVQHLDFMSDDQKKVFKTAYEIPQTELVKLAADRQKYICQSQSLNLFFPHPISMKHLHDVHVLAWETGVKTLYYLRSSSVIKALAIDSKDECVACQ